MRYLSEGKIEELKVKLAELRARRIAIAERLREVLEYGDIKENSEYDEATEVKEEIEMMIAKAEELISEARVVRVWSFEEIILGSRVIFEVNGIEKELLLADPAEAMPEEGIISVESPIGRGALGRRVGEEFLVTTPRGKVAYRIKKIIA